MQIYVEPEFRNRGYALEALKLLLREHNSLRVDDPSVQVAGLVEQLGFVAAGTDGSEEGRPLAMFVRTRIHEDD